MNFKFSLEPGQTKGVNMGEGDFFAVVLCPGDLEIKIPGGEFALFGQGDSYTLPPGQHFTRLEVRNPSATNGVQVLLFAGYGRYEQRRQSVIEPDTEFSASAVTSLASHANVTFDGFPTGDRIRRKSVQVSNLDNALSLHLIDKNGNLGLVIPATHSMTLPISEYVQLYNPNGSAVSFALSEIWWTL